MRRFQFLYLDQAIGNLSGLKGAWELFYLSNCFPLFYPLVWNILPILNNLLPPYSICVQCRYGNEQLANKQIIMFIFLAHYWLMNKFCDEKNIWIWMDEKSHKSSNLFDFLENIRSTKLKAKHCMILFYDIVLYSSAFLPPSGRNSRQNICTGHIRVGRFVRQKRML